MSNKRLPTCLCKTTGQFSRTVAPCCYIEVHLAGSQQDKEAAGGEGEGAVFIIVHPWASLLEIIFVFHILLVYLRFRLYNFLPRQVLIPLIC